jgi:hypothetical protein
LGRKVKNFYNAFALVLVAKVEILFQIGKYWDMRAGQTHDKNS